MLKDQEPPFFVCCSGAAAPSIGGELRCRFTGAADVRATVWHDNTVRCCPPVQVELGHLAAAQPVPPQDPSRPMPLLLRPARFFTCLIRVLWSLWTTVC